MKGENFYEYFYSKRSTRYTLYSSCYAVMALDLFDELSKINDDMKQLWADYLNSFQDDDGLFKDPVVSDSRYVDCDWWGWRHLTCHIIVALSCLSKVAKKEFKFLEKFYEPDFLFKWLNERNFSTPSDANNAGNEILNIASLIQYSRDFHNNQRAKRAVELILDWLIRNQNPHYGAWGPEIDLNDRISLAEVMMGGYHEFLLFFYDNVDFNYKEIIIDRILSLQNEKGGFTGPHHIISSACQDIDCIDPLCRLYFKIDYRKKDIENALETAIPNILSHQNKDGGFCFFKDKEFEYGHREMYTKVNESSMFATWFRVLSLGLIGKIIKDFGNLKFINCPGYQFWR
ncbi:MAG: hypothetical protein NC913_07065 [Candidatus Omnitrophica bacterium]|nr:hypothetical protein [Candidatus Omnitrophota bacterium]